MSKMKLKNSSKASFRSIIESPTNNSISKQAHAFSKSPRFPTLRSQCPTISYDGDIMKSRRDGAGIGIGKKSDFTRDLTCSPPPSKYQLKTMMQSNIKIHKGYSIGESRDRIRFGSYVDRQKLNNPSSNKYKFNNQVIYNKHPHYSLGYRTKILDKTRTIESLNNNPGPADYYNAQNQKRSSMILSGHINLSYSSSKSTRFPNADNRIPGPGNYKEVANLSRYGNYPTTKHKGGLIAKFFNGRRITKFDQVAKKSIQIPGAGSYRAPSQFGYDNEYDDLRQKLKKFRVPSFKK